MKHLIISRELPPSSYSAGGIGTYVANIARLLAEQGDTVHLIGERWHGAPDAREVLHDGRLIVHRIGKEDLPRPRQPLDAGRLGRELDGLKQSEFSAQWFAWSAAFLIERLVEEEGIDTIEAQEWEAPLYYFLLRRSLGLGPDRRPPCIVHLHSPTVFIHHYNGPARFPKGFDTVSRMEEFCIRSADALLCPSRSLADQASERYGIPRDRIETIPLPVGFAPPILRDEDIWANGSICYVGRIEPRKGIIEWVEAAIRVARRRPEPHFDFVGADIWGLQDALVEQIGPDLAPRFRFHGPKSRDEIGAFLARANAAVVPSRWENFPNVCIEAMSSGLPVIATRYGGMIEMVEDGQTGWLAEDCGIAGLTDSLVAALDRCLDTSPAEKAQMGARAAAAIRRYCDNDATVATHQRYRDVLRQQTASSTPDSDVSGSLPVRVIVRTTRVSDCEALLNALTGQSLLPAQVVVAHQEAAAPDRLRNVQAHTPFDLRFHHRPLSAGPQAWNDGTVAPGTDRGEAIWLFLEPDDEIAGDALESMARVFGRRPDLGVVSPWTLQPDGALDAPPSPTGEDQMIRNEVALASAFRGSALPASGPFRPGLPRGYDVWALANDVLAGGWAAVTYPALLARRTAAPNKLSWVQETALRAIRAEVLSSYSGDANRRALAVVNRFVPLDQQPHGGGRLCDKRLRRLALKAAEAALLRPRATAHRCLAFAKRRLARSGTST